MRARLDFYSAPLETRRPVAFRIIRRVGARLVGSRLVRARLDFCSAPLETRRPVAFRIPRRVRSRLVRARLDFCFTPLETRRPRRVPRPLYANRPSLALAAPDLAKVRNPTVGGITPDPAATAPPTPAFDITCV